MGFPETMKALSDGTRREILMLLRDKELTAGEIVERFSTSGATISHHLSILKEAGLVRDKKIGKDSYDELNLSVTEELMAWLSQLRGNEK